MRRSRLFHSDRVPRAAWQCGSLEDLLPGEQALVVELQGGHSLLSRMAAMGFTPGVEVSLIQNTRHGPLIACVRGARIAVGRGEARKILVRLLGIDEPRSKSI